jgi:hypothetical protein
MAQGFWRLARRERGAYPQGTVTSEQRRQLPKEPARLTPLFIYASLICWRMGRQVEQGSGHRRKNNCCAVAPQRRPNLVEAAPLTYQTD